MTEFKRNISGRQYQDYLTAQLAVANKFSFVTRFDVGVFEQAENLLAALQPFFIRKAVTTSWLANEVFPENDEIMAEIYEYQLNDQSLAVLLNHSNSLFDWGDGALSELPEDLALYHNDTPIFSVNGHEHYYETYAAETED